MDEPVSTADPNEEPVFILAAECGRLFETHLDAKVSSESNDTQQLIEEYQRLFWKWAQYVGVFAAGKASLDWRLRRNKMYQELFLLALDMLKANLQQCRVLPPDARSINSVESDSSDESDTYRAACDGVEESISQLNNLGISIRQPVTSRLHSKVKGFSSKRTIQLSDFETLASLAVERLYPDAATNLQQRLIKHMVGIHARILYWKSHAEKLSAQREEQQQSRAQKKSESPQSQAVVIDQSSLSQDVSHDKHKKRMISDTEATTLPSQYQNSSQRRNAEVKLTRSGNASTVMTSKVSFPPPPTAKDGHICWFCRKVHSADKYMSESWWRSHVNGDLLPYICLSDRCLGPKTFSSSGDWARHMTSQHGSDWTLNIHDSPVWTCDHIGSNHEKVLHFRTLETLNYHVRTNHNLDNNTTVSDQIGEAVTSNSSPIACPLCYMNLPRASIDRFSASTTEMSNAPDPSSKMKSGAERLDARVRFSVDVEAVVDCETEDESAQHQAHPDDEHLNINKALSSHIAEHLQRLALLTIRLKVDTAGNDDVTEFASDNPAADESISASATSTVKLLMNEVGHDLQDEMSVESETEKAEIYDTPSSVTEESAPNAGIVKFDHESRLSITTKLRDSVLQCPHDSTLAFLPNDSLDNIMKAGNIQEYISASEHPTIRSRCTDIIKFVCGNSERKASGIFAVLLLIEHPQLIVDFMEEAISDDDLPLCLRDKEKSHFTQYCLDKKIDESLTPIKRFDKWESTQRFAFYNHQWWVKLPVFEKSTSESVDDHPAIRLHDSSILPWIEFKPIYQHNSAVVRVRIHDAHHTFQPEENKAFAIKSVKSDVVAFQLEVKALLKIKHRKHLVKLLTTYEHQNKYHLIFRWAEGGNLADLWKQHIREPQIDRDRICWLAEQCYGLAHGLDGIHDTRLSGEEVEDIQESPLSISSKSAPRSKYPTIKYVNSLQDEDFGRHGDIKPENVLWFSQDGNQFGHGELKISDFGLTTFHSANSTKSSPRGIAVTHTYMAPEYDLNEDLSRPFDIWSLGCTYLEFITWMLLGASGLEQFSEIRLQETGTKKNFLCDNFYKIIREGHDRRAELKESVKRWIYKIKEEPTCSAFLSEFLDYIQDSMMVIDKSGRSGIRDVTKWLGSRYKACLEDKTYVLGRSPLQEPSQTPGNLKRKHS